MHVSVYVWNKLWNECVRKAQSYYLFLFNSLFLLHLCGRHSTAAVLALSSFFCFWDLCMMMIALKLWGRTLVKSNSKKIKASKWLNLSLLGFVVISARRVSCCRSMTLFSRCCMNTEQWFQSFSRKYGNQWPDFVSSCSVWPQVLFYTRLLHQDQSPVWDGFIK